MNKRILTGFTMACVGFGCSHLRSEDWPKLSGPHSNWISNDKGLADSWPKDGPKLVWSVADLGGGFASPVVANGKVFIIGRALDTSFKDKHGNIPQWSDAKCLPGPDVLSCLDRTTGKTIWKHEFNALTTTIATGWNTPTVDGDVLYARGGDGEVRCINVKDGKQIWAWPKKGEELFNGKNQHKLGLASGGGCAASITVCDDVLVLMGGSLNGHSILVGLNRKTGEKLWNTDEFTDWQFGDRNHVVLDLGKKKVVLTQEMVLDVNTGKKLDGYKAPPFGFHSEWCSAFEGNKYFGAVARSGLDLASPYYVKGHGQGMECLEFVLKDDGTVEHKSLWQWFTDWKNPVGQVMEKGFSGPLLVNGYLYLFLGYKGNSGHLTCLDAATGKETWKEIVTPPHLFVSCPIYADGKILYVNDEGLLVMIAADPKEYKLLSKAPAIGKTWSSMALSDGFAFVRDDLGAAKCFDLRKP